MPTCWHCKAETTEDHHRRVVYNHTTLHGPWDGWRMAGRELVSPDGERITTERLRGLMVRQALEARRDAARRRNEKRVSRMPVKVIVVDLADWQTRHFGRAAG